MDFFYLQVVNQAAELEVGTLEIMRILLAHVGPFVLST